ncbi:MAG TPA: hypothetical protein VFX33_16355 [Actinomycetales bacterium]|nr:hypothetical protein [Actinomycetales bacterium]
MTVQPIGNSDHPARAPRGRVSLIDSPRLSTRAVSSPLDEVPSFTLVGVALEVPLPFWHPHHSVSSG